MPTPLCEETMGFEEPPSPLVDSSGQKIDHGQNLQLIKQESSDLRSPSPF